MESENGKMEIQGKYDIHTKKHDDGKWWLYDGEKLLIGLGGFETEEAANDIVKILS